MHMVITIMCTYNEDIGTMETLMYLRCIYSRINWLKICKFSHQGSILFYIMIVFVSVPVYNVNNLQSIQWVIANLDALISIYNTWRLPH